MKFELNLNFKIIREDLRKLGLVFVGGGFVGIVVNSDKVTIVGGTIISLLGFTIWIISVVNTPSDVEDL